MVSWMLGIVLNLEENRDLEMMGALKNYLVHGLKMYLYLFYRPVEVKTIATPIAEVFGV